VGLTGLEGRQALAEILAYDMTEAKPQKLEKEHEKSYFVGLANYPTPKLQYPVRKIVFSIRSKDQGWSSEPQNRRTFNGSWTWFEAGLEKFDAEQTCKSAAPGGKHETALHQKWPICHTQSRAFFFPRLG
jgi:hypothetical protein